MKKKNKLFCAPIVQIPLLLQITNDYFFISYFIIAGFLIFLITRSIGRSKKKLIIKDSLFWILSVITLSFFTFAVLAFNFLSLPTSSLHSIAPSYLLIYINFFAILFLGFVILKIFFKIRIAKISLFVLGVLLFFFLALYIKILKFPSKVPSASVGSFSSGDCGGERPFF
jgi:hypothetical protein